MTLLGVSHSLKLVRFIYLFFVDRSLESIFPQNFEYEMDLIIHTVKADVFFKH